MRFPAEWAPQRRTWLAWPHHPGNWRARPGIVDFYVELIGLIRGFQPVSLLVPAPLVSALPQALSASAAFPLDIFAVPTNDIWIRDYGPIFVEEDGRLRIISFAFNAWGEKFPPFDLDNRVPNRMARLLDCPIVEYPLVFEGGAIETNGEGAGITTADCLVGPHRNLAPLEQLTSALRSALGFRDLLVLPKGLDGDHTDGHIDNIARFVGADHVVAARAEEASSPNYPVLEDALARLEAWKPGGKTLRVSTLPLPPQRVSGDERLPASYMNFIYVNNGLIVPLYRCEHDETALRFFEEIYPERTVLGIDCTLVIEEGGSLHCLSKQEPEVSTPALIKQ